MACISVSGIVCAVQISVSALLVSAAMALPVTSMSGAEQIIQGHIDLNVRVSGLKNDSGLLRYCVAPRGATFPDCEGDGILSGGAHIKDHAASFIVQGLARGDYAVAVFHDQNGNSRLDTFAGIPREGYGFSRNPGFRPRAPKFEEAAINLSQSTNTEIRIRYIF